MDRVARDGLTLTLVQFLRISCGTLMLIAVPLLLADLGYSAAEIGIVYSLSNVALAVAALYLGKLSQIVGRKVIYAAGFVAIACIKPLFVLVKSLPAFTAVRIADQTGNVFVDSVQDALRADLFPVEHRPRLMAQVFVGFSAGRYLGALLGMLIAASFAPASAFYVGTIFLVAALLIVLLFIHDTPKAQASSFRLSLSWKGYSADFRKMAAFEALENYRWTVFYPYFWLYLYSVIGTNPAENRVLMYGLLCVSNIIAGAVSWFNRSRLGPGRLVSTAVLIILADMVLLVGMTQVASLIWLSICYVVLDFNTVARKPASLALGMNAANESLRGEQMAFLKTVSQLAGILGPVSAGMLAAHLSPVAPFFVCAATKLAQIWLLRALSPDVSREREAAPLPTPAPVPGVGG